MRKDRHSTASSRRRSQHFRLLSVVVILACLTSALPAVEEATPGADGEILEDTWSAFNLHLFISEAFANRVVAHQQTETDQVRDFILGADIFGQQTTETHLTIDFKPSENLARLNFILNGVTYSETVGITSKAIVNTFGRHYFSIVKESFFDGAQFTTRLPMAVVAANNFNRGVGTPLSCAPFVGPLVDRYAYCVAESQRPAAEAIAAQRLTDRVTPRFNSSTDRQLAATNRRWANDVLAPLRKADLLPKVQSVTTTEHALIFRARVGSKSTEAVPPAQSPKIPDKASLAAAAHESLLTALADLLELNGKSLTDRELDQLVSQLREFLGSEPPDSSDDAAKPKSAEDTAAPQFATFVFDENNPVRVRIDSQSVTITLRAALIPIVGNRIPPLDMTIPLQAEIIDDRVLINPGEVTVTPVDAADASAPSSVVLTLIRQRLKSRIEPIELPGKFPLPVSETKTLTLAVKEIVAEGGWLIVTLD